MKKILVLAMAAAAVVACQKTGNEPANSTQGSAMNLVTSISNNGTRAAVDGTSLPANAKIGVQLVQSTATGVLYPSLNTDPDFTDGKNVPFQYSADAKGWICGEIAAPKKFILDKYNATPGAGEVDYKATPFAYYPYTADANVIGIGADATIPVSTIETETVVVPATIDGTDDTKNVYTTEGKFAANAEVDYMWAKDNTPTKELHAANTDADFEMNHGLARVSFVLTKAAVITEDIFFEGFSMKSTELKGADLATSTMKISDGTLTGLTPMQYNRTVQNYKIAISPAAIETDLAKYVWVGAVVAPTSGFEATGEKAISVDVTISKKNGTAGSVYSVLLPITKTAEWKAGNHYVYHIEMVNMNSLKVRQVTVINWADTFGGSVSID